MDRWSFHRAFRLELSSLARGNRKPAARGRIPKAGVASRIRNRRIAVLHWIRDVGPRVGSDRVVRSGALRNRSSLAWRSWFSMESASVEFDWRSRVRSATPHIIIGALIGGAALLLAVRGVDWRSVGGALVRTNPTMALLALGSVFLTLLLSVIRWSLLFAPEHRNREWIPLAGAILIGQTVNTALPGRIGELARMYLVGRREGLSKAHVMATIVVEKVADLAMFAVSIGLLVVAMSLPDWMARSGVAFVWTAAILVVATVALTFWHDRILLLIERLALRLPRRWTGRVVRFAEAALSALRSLRDWRRGLMIWILSAAVLILSILTNYLVFVAMRLPLGLTAALFLAVVLRVGAAPPSLPGKIGLFHYLVVLALSLFGVDKTTALSYAFVLYAVAVLPVVIAGTASAFAIRWSPAQAIAQAE